MIKYSIGLEITLEELANLLDQVMLDDFFLLFYNLERFSLEDLETVSKHLDTVIKLRKENKSKWS